MLNEIRCISGCCSYTIPDSLKGNIFNVSIYVFWQKPPCLEKGHFMSPAGSYQRANGHNSSNFANFWTNKNVKINQRKPQTSPLRFTLLLTWDEIIHLTTSWFGFQPISSLNRCRTLKDQNTRPNLYTWNLYLDKLLPYWRTTINLKFKLTTGFLFSIIVQTVTNYRKLSEIIKQIFGITVVLKRYKFYATVKSL